MRPTLFPNSGFENEHAFKDDILWPKKNGSEYDICACDDGTFVLRPVKKCGMSSEKTKSTGYRYR